jgi:hypothetical protein
MALNGVDYWKLADEAERAGAQAQSPVARQSWRQLASDYRRLAKLKQQPEQQAEKAPKTFLA